MENNHTDVGRFQERPPARPKPVPIPERPQRRERLSITEWMAQTLDEMKRRVGWFKENPEVTRIRQMTKVYPDLDTDVEKKLARVERKADTALAEAREELRHVIQEPTPIEMAPQERYITPKMVDPTNIEAWNEFKFELIKDFERAFSTPAPREGDFEVTLSAPLSSTTFKDLREHGPQPVRVRSESVGGVRVDAVFAPPNSNKISEYRVYDLDGYYKTIPGNQDPVEVLIDSARTNLVGFQYMIKAEERAKENARILRGGRTGIKGYDTPLSLEQLIQKRGSKLGSVAEYSTQPERMMKPIGDRGRAGPEVGELKQPVPSEPAVNLGSEGLEYALTEPEVEAPVDRFTQAMEAKYGKDVASRLEQHLFANQDLYDQYMRAWESATHNTSLKPEQQELTQKVFAALTAEGKDQGLAGKGSYAYLVESYQKDRENLPRLQEAIDTVKEIMGDPTTPEGDKPDLQKELNYLNHLRVRLEYSPKQSLHQSIEKFLDQNQHLLTLGEIREIMEADQTLDSAEAIEQVREKVFEAMDFPARLVLDKKLSGFLKDYERFMLPREKAGVKAKLEEIKTAPGPLNFWDEDKEVSDFTSSIKRRAWNRVIAESFTRVDQALKKYEHELDDVAYPIVAKLRLELQQALPTTAGESLNLNPLQDIFRRFGPVEFERYITSLLHAATGADMRPAWEKTDEELRPAKIGAAASEPVRNETWVEEPPRVGETFVNEAATADRATPVMVEEYDEGEEYEDVSAEIPDLVRELRSAHTTPEAARLAASRTREILENAGSNEMIELTGGMLQKLDTLKSGKFINEKVYQRSLARLLSADSFNAREEAIRDLQADLPLAFMHQPGKARYPVPDRIPQEKRPDKKEVA